MKTTKFHEIIGNKIIVINSAMKITIFFMINSHRGILYVYKLSNNCTYINIGTVRELVLYFTALYFTLLFYAERYYTLLCCTVMCSAVLLCTVLY